MATTAGNVLKGTYERGKKTWKTKFAIGTIVSIATIYSSLLAAENGDKAAAGADLRDGVVAVARPIGGLLVGGAEFAWGFATHDGDNDITVSAPQINAPSINLGGNPDSCNLTLAQGERTEDNSIIQSALAATGDYTARVDGVAGPMTMQAIAEFDQSQGLDGAWDNGTCIALQNAVR